MDEVYNLDYQLIKGRVPKDRDFPFTLSEWKSLERYRISTTEKVDVFLETEFLKLAKNLSTQEFDVLFRLVTHKVSRETINSFILDTKATISQGSVSWDSDKWNLIVGNSKDYKLGQESISSTLDILKRISEVNVDLHKMFIQLKKRGYDVDDHILNMRRFPLGNFKKAISELDRILGNPLEIEKKSALRSDVKRLPQIEWLNRMIPSFANELVSGKIDFTAGSYQEYEATWKLQSDNRQENSNVKKVKAKAKYKAKTNSKKLEINAFINPAEKYFEFFGSRMNSDEVNLFVTQRENYITKIPGKVTEPEPPFSLEEWNMFKQHVNSKRNVIVSATKESAPRFSKLVDVNPTNPNIFWMKWKQLTKAWAFKYLLVEFLRMGWLVVSDIQNYAVKVTLRQEIAFIENSNLSTLNLLNEGAGKFTSKVNTKVNVKRANKSEGTPREKLSYEERRKRKAQKYLNYLDDQMYYENHYVRQASTRQTHNDGGGWS
ncbi:hypothetical protein FM131_04610 [Weissella confusa]|uniref:hypothetical protein n=1 Tax=Weissella confusa TaxID=1583 RepID=UPI000989A17E|nr:hypothetical protein [Weissella confusa]SJX68667.1 hypothetical protein FM131_04610 [Weissella confusa]